MCTFIDIENDDIPIHCIIRATGRYRPLFARIDTMLKSHKIEAELEKDSNHDDWQAHDRLVFKF